MRTLSAAIAFAGTAFAALTLAALAPASAQSWPSKPLRVIVPFGAGSATDVVPRIVLDELSKRLGQPIVIENRVGAGSTTGTALVAKAEPDGYTLLSTSSAYTVTPSLYESPGYDAAKDLVGVAMYGALPSVMIVTASAPYNSLADFVAAAKAKPGTMNFASVGVGSAVHMAAERFRLAAGYEAAHVPFKSGSEALTEVVAGRMDYYFCPVNTAIQFIKEGKLKALAVSSPQRISVLPAVPTTIEAGFKDSDYTIWVGMLAPAKTPKDVVERLHKEVMASLATPTVRERLIPNGLEPLPLSPADFDALIAGELKSNSTLAKALKLKAS